MTRFILALVVAAAAAAAGVLTVDAGSLLVVKRQVDDDVVEADEPVVAPASPPPRVYNLHIESTIRARYATTHVSSRIGNSNHNKSQEVKFQIILPDTAFISKFVMIIDNIPYTAYVREKEEAKKEYDAAVKHGMSAGHVSLSPRDSNKFDVSVNVAAQEKVTFNLTYEELLSRRLGAYEQAITVDAGQVVPDLVVKACVYEVFNITKLKIPEIRKADTNEINGTDNKLAKTERLSPSSACVTYQPSEQQQKDMSQEGIAGQFLVQYDVERKQDAGEVYVLDGYFVHFFSPPELKPLPKHMVFVLDVSGSMSGRRIEQLKEAMLTILSDLTPDDRFNIITFSFSCEIWDPRQTHRQDQSDDYYSWGRRLRPHVPAADIPVQAYTASPDNIAKAKNFIRNMEANGGTNIHDALLEGLRYSRLRPSNNKGQLEPLLVFLTDGEPTVGIVSTEAIMQSVGEANRNRPVPIFSLAFGTDTDFNFLKKLSLKNGAFARKIYEASDAALQLKGFYAEIASPLLSNVTFQYMEEAVDNSTLTKNRFGSYFAGSELVVAGKIQGELKNDTEIKVVVNGMSSAGAISLHVIRLPPPCIFYPHYYWHHWPRCLPPPYIPDPPSVTPPPTKSQLFVERLWAYLTIRQLLDKKDSGSTEPVVYVASKPVSAKERAVELALKYGFVTPVTSLVVVKPNSTVDKSVDPVDVSGSPKALSSSPGFFSMRKSASRIVGGAGPLPAFHTAKLMAGGGGAAGGGAAGGGGIRRKMTKVVKNKQTASPPPATESEPTGASTVAPRTTTPSGLKVLNLHNIRWLRDKKVKNDVYSPLEIPGRGKFDIVNSTQLDIAGQNCTAPFGSGNCRHLRYCVQKELESELDVFLKSYFCIVDGHYVGTCCPPNFNGPTQPPHTP